MRLLCLGDSNTYGYDPRSYFGGRYPAEHRWVDILTQASGWEVINDGENGREIPHRAREIKHFLVLLQRCQPIDLLLIMLGSNDLLQGQDVSGVTARLTALLEALPINMEQIVLISPPPMKMGLWVTEERLLTDSAALAPAFRSLAERFGTRFLDAGKWNIALTFDGLHFSEAGHRTFAEQLYLALNG